VSIVLDLTTRGMHLSFGRFGYMCDTCELEALGYTWVTQEKIHYNEYDA
jgi:hypothetical protein